MTDLISETEKISGLLNLRRKVVGVKRYTSRTALLSEGARGLLRPLGYCVAVKCAMAGFSIRLSPETSGCPGSNRALGFTVPMPSFYDGTHGCGMGLFKNKTVASTVAAAVPLLPADTCGVIVKPLELFEATPDVVLMTGTPRTMMRILQGYTHEFGLPRGMHMSGNQAVCVECTVTPMKTGSINVSMFCSGTRYRAGWKDSEAMAGIPFEKFYKTVEGIEKTVNPVEPDARKKEIAHHFSGSNHLTIEIEYGKTYYKKKK